MQVNALAHSLADLSTELVRRFRLLERQELACCGIPLSQALVLQRLRAEDRPLTMSEVASALGVAQSTATRLVEPLVRQGLVAREQGADDGRVVRLRLTARGEESARELAAGTERCSTAILERIPAASRETAVAALEVLVSAVSQCCDTGCCEVSGD